MIINMNGAKAPETPSPVLQEKTVTPETLPTVIGPDEGYDGLTQVTVNPDPQLKAENIRSGKTVFGVTGSFVGEPSLGVDFDQITGKSVGVGIDFPLFISNAFNVVANPTMIDKPFESSRYMYNSSNTKYCLVGYGVGGIGAREDNSNPIQKSTYIPADSWYGVSGVIGGEMTFRLSQLPQNTVGAQCSHVKGTVLVCPIIALGSFKVVPNYNQNYQSSSFIDKPNIETIELDHDLTPMEGFMGFTMTLPEVNYTIYGTAYGTVKYASMGYALLPEKVLIS